MAKNYFRRYIWLIELINRKGYISFREISDAWSRSPLNETGAPLSERTFFNHKDAIFDTFGIEILNDRSLGFYIGHSDVGNDETADWMLHTLCMNNLLQENSDMRDRILVDRVPSSEKFLTNVISAMRDSKTIMLYYQSFRHPEPHGFNVRPYCVKFFKQRWYMLGDSDLGLRVYSLDRFVDMEELDIRYELPKGFDAEGQITSAIQYVTMDANQLPVVYQITGHDEATIGSAFSDVISKSNMTLSSVELLNEESVPKDAAAIIINAPQKDFNKNDAQKVIDYLQKGGKAIIVGMHSETEMPNFASILDTYGVSLTTGPIADNDAQHYYNMGGPLYLLPNVNSSSYTGSLSGGYVYLPISLGINYPQNSTTDDTESTEESKTTYTSLLDTSDDAGLWIRRWRRQGTV